MTIARIDPHTHSVVSDGTDTPAGLVAEAARAGLDVVGLTDHDTTAGWSEAVAAGVEHGVSILRGMEISTQYEHRSIHLLAYLFDPADAGLLARTERARSSRVERARMMVERIAEDFPITWEQVAEQVTAGATIGRPHIADALVAAGHVPDRSAAFAPGGPVANRTKYYVPHYAPDVQEAIELVRAAGGVPVIAHPFAARGRGLHPEAIPAAIEAGLLGVEIEHRDHDDDARAQLRRLAGREGLIVTGSSDYHGRGKVNRLGENLTAPDQLERIVAAGSLPLTGGGPAGVST
ncbi:COG0613, Predicted metal-dependent phosphoesterases (PHP family) [Actinomycetales bacterium JB111]|nr:COG0613, Predicted metal-dependent phosphoesterases (PHP family) [Actinomycetales bacterium JB111]